MINRTKHTILDFLPALMSSNFRLYVYGQSISLIGTWLAQVAEQWLIYPTLSQNKSLIGVVSALNLLPTAALVLFGGVIADRIDKRKASIVIQTMFGLVSFMLGVLIATHQIQLWHVMVAAIVSGTFFALDMPIRNTLMLELVEKEHYPSALSLNSGMFNAARAIGPAFAGFLIAWMGVASAYVLNAISFIAVVISLFYLRLPKHTPSKQDKSYIAGLKEGLRFIKNDSNMITLLVLLAIISSTGWPITTLFPIFAHDIFKTGEVGFGLIQSFLGMGALGAAFMFTKVFDRVENKKKILYIGSFLSMVSFILFAATSNFVVALNVILINGVVSGLIFGTINSLLQLEVPSELRGRVMSIYSFVLFGSMPLGAIILSLFLRAFQISHIVIFAAIIQCSLTFFILSRFSIPKGTT